ncbi:unknown [Crocosphaera subtropica ATCC 51142]|uniref:Glycosyltransferase subfamily 4-like N-terminal domain-containing protein n=1 Tax=Crocosphaera subtropica (strain ATCC 51142 / BH68) TaxID=43989 RepID=B1WP93_CROS5|nr:glycosyltransferase [Crocosphaera subtropica]ACB49875.1 unknown [Crocosphaera subtropica ATCC 51142]
MKTFIIIDHSLCNLQGHHYECSLSVAESAARQGYEPIIVANKAFPKTLYPNNIKVIPAFEVDWFDNPVSSKEKNKILDFFDFLENHPLEKLSEKINHKFQFYFRYWELTQPKLKALLEKIKGSTSRLLNWIQQDIDLLRSIPFSNTLWGIFKIIWGLVRYILATFLRKVNKALIKLLTPKNESFKDTLSNIFKEIKLTSEDEVFIHTIGIKQVEDVYHYLASADLSKMPRFHILLRRDIDDPLVVYAPGMGLKAIFDNCYNSQLWPDKIQFYTDTDDLIQRYNSLSNVKLYKIPIPFRQEKLTQIVEKADKNKPVHLVYLGDARPEKGYHYLPNIVEYLWTDYIQPGKIKVTIQSNFSIEGGEGLIPQARLALERYPDSKVKLIKTAMSADDYYQLLAEADALILPYDTNSYRFRTSGVLTEALAAGKPVIVPQNSWLGKQVDSSRASLYENSDEIPKKVIEIVENLDRFSESARKFSKRWLEQNSPDSLVKTLLDGKDNNYVDYIEENKVESDINHKKVINNIPKLLPKILLVIESDFLLDQEADNNSFSNYLEYLGLCGYEVYGLFFTNKQERKGENYEPFYHQVYPVIDRLFQEFSVNLKERWIIDYGSPDLIPDNFSLKEYIKEVLNNKNSFKRNLIERYNLSIPSDLSQLLQTNQFDVIFLNSIVSYSIIDRFNIKQSSIICEVPEIASYQYAVNNHRDIEQEDYQLECQLLNQCDALIFHHQYELEKIKETINKPQAYVISGNENSNQTDYYQTMDQVFKALLNDRAIPLKATGEKVAILYPWGDILERKSGASKRVGLLIDYLKLQSYQVRLFTTGDAKDFREDGVHYTYYQQSYQDYCLINDLYKDAYQSWFDALNFETEQNNQTSENSKLSDHWLPWIYYQYRFDSGFIDYVKKIAEWADTVILEYPFWALTVGEICHQLQTQLLITAHDILAQQLDLETLIGKIALAEEIKALKQADHLICVSETDQNFLKQYQLSSTVIPNPINLEQDTSDDLLLEVALPKINSPFCLFVGSQHQPNIEAVKIIQQIAKDFLTDYPDIACQFVIVGSCCEPEEKNNFIALGKVSDQELSALYYRASLILSPILSGTGTSLKIVEAMAYGKLVLGTNVAFRGYSVESGEQCLICDRLDDYSHIITQWLNNSQKRENIEKNAQEFAKNYDYRNLYYSYKQLIEKSDKLIRELPEISQRQQQH